ncbi:MAG: FtsW/RodA/SpoVE family cell cycle protein, partial [Pseudomonadota bacterium]|nr:FtsW/RodA/SpoVE family cell cycle protein [Pseudomonadota bacterium]
MQASRQQRAASSSRARSAIDFGLITPAVLLVGLGLIMVTSASLEIADQLTGDPLHYLKRQLIFVGAGFAILMVAYRVPLEYWRQVSLILVVGVMFLLVLVLVPGIGKPVNGSNRWLSLGGYSLQVSELAKLC